MVGCDFMGLMMFCNICLVRVREKKDICILMLLLR